MKKDFWEALLMRSVHAIWETAVSTLPATIVITPAMIEHFDLDTALGIFYVVLAWALTAIFSGFLSAAKSMKVGMPEAQLGDDPEEDDEDDFDDDDFDDEEGDE